MKWISVDDRLPDEEYNYSLFLIWHYGIKNMTYDVAEFSNGVWYTEHSPTAPTHWQPLPPPPEAEVTP